MKLGAEKLTLLGSGLLVDVSVTTSLILGLIPEPCDILVRKTTGYRKSGDKIYQPPIRPEPAVVDSLKTLPRLCLGDQGLSMQPAMYPVSQTLPV